MTRILDTVNSPGDVKRLSIGQMSQLAGEIREELISVVSTLGGHLASSLGAVELCLAVHEVFDAPHDHLVWDMGYQAYAHKLITGRRDRLHTLKQLKGLTGFNNKDESPYDLFTTGHGGTCLSTAMGLAIACDRARVPSEAGWAKEVPMSERTSADQAGAPRHRGGVGDGRVPSHSAFRSLSDSGCSRSVDARSGSTDHAQAKRHVVAMIGDASLGEGMALEALNHIGHVKPNLIVILNDNKMSIATPVGGLSRYLNRIITNPLYNRLRRDVEQMVSKLPKGARLIRMSHKVQESLKGLLTPGSLFEELGFRYVGPINGHDLQELVTTLRNVKRLKGPILLHVLTIKGKGYRPAEQDPEQFHKIEPFDIATGHLKSHGIADFSIQNPKSKIRNDPRPPATFTEAFGEELVRLGEADERIIAITAAMPEGTGVAAFGKRFPNRYFDVGMAEQHGLGLAAGLARAGRQPVVAFYSTFLQRAYDQIMHELSLQNLPVILAIDRGGLVGEDGPTHHGAFDISYLRPLPNMVVISPKDPDELRAMLRWALARPGSEIDGRAGEAPGPVAIRYSRGGIVGEPLGKPAKIALGKSELLRQGKDLAILALGSLAYPALEAAANLKQEGIDAAVVNARFVKPLDQTLLRHMAAQCHTLVTIEEGMVAGGFGSAVSEALETMGLHTVPLLRIGLPDQFIEHGKRAELLKLCQLDADGLSRRILTWYSDVTTEFRVASFEFQVAPETRNPKLETRE